MKFMSLREVINTFSITEIEIRALVDSKKLTVYSSQENPTKSQIVFNSEDFLKLCRVNEKVDWLIKRPKEDSERILNQLRKSVTHSVSRRNMCRKLHLHREEIDPTLSTLIEEGKIEVRDVFPTRVTSGHRGTTVIFLVDTKQKTFCP